MSTFKKLLLYCGIAVVGLFILTFGINSCRLKQALLNLLKAKHDLELEKTEKKKAVLKAKIKEVEGKRRDAVASYRKYIKSVNSASKSQ